MKKTNPKIAVLIVAGGSGTRMANTTPKQYLPINGKSILCHTLDIFETIEEITIIKVVIGKGHEELYTQTLKDRYQHPYIIGGDTRQESVCNGLLSLEKDSPDIVLIHDAARPCVTKDDIHKLINSLDDNRAATLAQPVTETLQRDKKVIDRENLWIIQTPQGFFYNDLLEAHKKVHETYTDDTAVYMAWSNKPISYVPCGRHNIKITTQDDLIMAEKLLKNDMTETITGIGFDVHAFDNDNAADTIRLCGIDIPYHRALRGHSDADVGLHALTDAILGALADGDIGSHFPPSDNSFKNMDSHIFLNKALDILTSKGAQIRHIDLILMCEEPKIGPYRDKIRTHLSDYIDIPRNRISVKATTTEKLGFTGRGEGIACQCSVTIRKPCND